MRSVAVIDIGKTNLKVALVDLALGAEVAVETQANPMRDGPPWPHFDTEAQWTFLTAALRRLGRMAPIDGIAVTTHGACAALLDAGGALVAPVLDYEHTGPDALRTEYETLRPPFAETGSPALPMGLNLGAQLHFMLRQDPGLAARVAHVVMWPQYWGFRLTGQIASDLSSLGCHTDLWNPHAGTWSALPGRLGLGGRMAPARKPGEVLGTLRPGLQADLGLPAVPVLVGIHDSNASLLPHLRTRRAPFAVVSTGTWVIAMAVGGAAGNLDPRRDTLVNVSADGDPVPSARFMGGREHALVLGQAAPCAQAADARAVADRQVMLLPSVVEGSGPFPAERHRWTDEPRNPAEREVAVGHYLAMMTAECLGMIGAAGPVIVEGPFCENRWFLTMLAAATRRPVLAARSRTGTAIGAAMLFRAPETATTDTTPVPVDPALEALAGAWRARCPQPKG